MTIKERSIFDTNGEIIRVSDTIWAVGIREPGPNGKKWRIVTVSNQVRRDLYARFAKRNENGMLDLNGTKVVTQLYAQKYWRAAWAEWKAGMAKAIAHAVRKELSTEERDNLINGKWTQRDEERTSREKVTAH